MMDKVRLRKEKLIIPTYEISGYDKNPMFLEKRVYQGSSGRVYPHPVCESVSDKKTDKEYTAIFLENDYIEVMILPEIGGRIQRLYDKTNGYDCIYYNEVIKPALVGLAGPWISGGIEFNWPQHHRPSTYDPVDYTVKENDDGSVTVFVGETEKMFHQKGMAAFTVYPDKAYLEIKGQLYNPTDRPQTFLWWANPAVPVNDFTQSIFPPDVTAVTDHGKRDVSKFPIADGIYYKVDYSPGTDISRYKNIPVPTSYMAYHSEYDFMGNYDYSKNAGLIHISDHHLSPGKKQWTWGCGEFGKAWDRNLTDENGPYIELMTGVFTDNQPDFTYLKPYEEKTFTQYFMPYKMVGAVKNASTDIIMNADIKNGEVVITVYSPAKMDNVRVMLTYNDIPVLNEITSVSPNEVYCKTVLLDVADAKELTLAVFEKGKKLLSYTPQDNEKGVPLPAEPIPEPELLKTTEKLFLAATHLEQYRHATYSPQPYYLEGLRRDPSDIRLNNGYGKYLYNRGRAEESIPYFEQAIKSSTWKNPNPYDCEPYFNLGIALKAIGERDKAFDAFYKAVWDGNQQDKAFYQLASIAAGKRDYSRALELVNQSLFRGLHNIKARTLKTVLLRLLGKKEEAVKFAKETMETDMLDHGCRYELYRMTGQGLDELKNIMRGDNHNYIELALTYMDSELYMEADNILSLAPDTDEPMIHYYRYFCTGDRNEMDAGERASSFCCFPNRTEDIRILKNAVNNRAEFAKYYLGCLYYDKGQWEKSVDLWESCADTIKLPTVYRNLSLAYYNKLRDYPKAQYALEKAFEMDKSDTRVFFELDQLYKALNTAPEIRLEKMKENAALLDKRDDLYTEYITLLNLNNEYDDAYNCIANHIFHPWEGGEGKITAQYRIALINKAKKEPEKAEEYLEQALIYPENLGEGKLIGNLDNDIYYMLGGVYRDKEKSEWAYKMAARGEFELSSAVYYNDQPPEMAYYAAKAIEKTGNKSEANRRFDEFIHYAEKHMNDEVKTDYFAVSLPDFLIFEGDLSKNNKLHCLYMAALGEMGKGNIASAAAYAKQGVELCKSHYGFCKILEILK